MAFTFNKEKLQGPKPVPPGIYTIAFGGFKPALSKEPNKNTGVQSVNLNFYGHILDMKTEDGKDIPVFATLNEGIPTWLEDFCHSFGVEFETLPDGQVRFPGTFEADLANYDENDPSTWKYAGPLIGRVAQWDLGIRTWQGRESNTPRQFICSVPDCATKNPQTRHTADMLRKG